MQRLAFAGALAERLGQETPAGILIGDLHCQCAQKLPARCSVKIGQRAAQSGWAWRLHQEETFACTDTGDKDSDPCMVGLYAWGWNSAGQLGVGHTQVSLQHLCARTRTRTRPTLPICSFGAHAGLQKNVQTPRLVKSLMNKRISMVACGGPSTVLLTDDDEVWAFGANNRGQLGLGENSESMEPKMLAPPKGMPKASWKVELIACGYAHTVFLADNG